MLWSNISNTSVPEPDPVRLFPELNSASLSAPAERVCSVLVLDARCDRWEAGEEDG